MDLEENYTSKWQQVVFASHTHFKREDNKKEHILPVNMRIDNQAGSENIMLQVKTFERVFKMCFPWSKVFNCGRGRGAVAVHKHLLSHFQHDFFSQVEKNLCREGSTCILQAEEMEFVENE